MTLDELLEWVGEPVAEAARFDYLWETTQATFPTALPFLEPGAIEASVCEANLSRELLPPLLAMAARIAATPSLAWIAWHAHQRLIVQARQSFACMVAWPRLLGVLGEEARFFWTLIALSAVPRVRELHRQLGIGDEVSRATCQAVQAVWLAFERYAPPEADGSPLRYLDWLRHHLAGKIFRLGRMEWLMGTFAGPVHVYRHRASGAVAALMEGGQAVAAHGGLCWETEAEAPGVWKTAFEPGPTAVSGYPVLPNGSVSGAKITLSHSEWEHVVSRGMEALDLHIPAGGGMTPAACRDSFREALRFFGTHFPEWQPRVFACQSWIFAPALAEILPPEMNLVRLQKEVHLYPLCTAPTGGLYFLFNTADRLPPALPATATRVQQAVHRHIAAGRPWRPGGMFLLPEELERFFAGVE